MFFLIQLCIICKKSPQIIYKTKLLVSVTNSISSILAHRQGMTILGYLTLESVKITGDNLMIWYHLMTNASTN